MFWIVHISIHFSLDAALIVGSALFVGSASGWPLVGMFVLFHLNLWLTNFLPFLERMFKYGILTLVPALFGMGLPDSRRSGNKKFCSMYICLFFICPTLTLFAYKAFLIFVRSLLATSSCFIGYIYDLRYEVSSNYFGVSMSTIIKNKFGCMPTFFRRLVMILLFGLSLPTNVLSSRC